MVQTMKVADLCERLGVSHATSSGSTRLKRHGYAVEVPEALSEGVDASDPTVRHLLFGVVFGVRLAIDREASTFEVAEERPERPERVFHAHEIPSVYGDRLPRLVSRLTVAWFEALTGRVALSSRWIDEELRLLYVLETGKHLHTFCEVDLKDAPLSREKLTSDARHALFYEAYKLKPRDKQRIDAGRLFEYRTAEGLGATRAILLPDYDYDAARAHGCFSTPSRDTLLIGRPRERAGADRVRERIAARTEQLVDREPFPLSSRLGTLTAEEAQFGEHLGPTKLPVALEEVPKAWLPPEGISVERLADG